MTRGGVGSRMFLHLPALLFFDIRVLHLPRLPPSSLPPFICARSVAAKCFVPRQSARSSLCALLSFLPPALLRRRRAVQLAVACLPPDGGRGSAASWRRSRRCACLPRCSGSVKGHVTRDNDIEASFHMGAACRQRSSSLLTSLDQQRACQGSRCSRDAGYVIRQREYWERAAAARYA